MDSVALRTEAEEILRADPAINQAKIVNLGDDHISERIVTISLTDPAASTPETDAAILKAARKTLVKKLGKGIVPKKWLIPGRVLPTIDGTDGEIDEERLRLRLLGKEEPSGDGETADKIRKNVSEILHIESKEVDMNKPFTKQGGDSITAIELMSKLMEEDIVLQLPSIVGTLTLAELATSAAQDELADQQVVTQTNQDNGAQAAPQPIAV